MVEAQIQKTENKLEDSVNDKCTFVINILLQYEF